MRQILSGIPAENVVRGGKRAVRRAADRRTADGSARIGKRFVRRVQIGNDPAGDESAPEKARRALRLRTVRAVCRNADLQIGAVIKRANDGMTRFTGERFCFPACRRPNLRLIDGALRLCAGRKAAG